jgi:hypothetical protein
MKVIDTKSLLIGALLGAAIVFSLAAATGAGTGTVWEYRVVPGNVFQDALGNAINSSVAEGWDFVSASGPNNNDCGFALLKRKKK